MGFTVEERSYITATGPGYSKTHQQLNDAMEAAINWLATRPVGTEVTIVEKTTIKRKA